MSTVTYQGKTFKIVPDSDAPVAGCHECVGMTLNNGICGTYGAGAVGATPNCMATRHHYEEVPKLYNRLVSNLQRRQHASVFGVAWPEQRGNGVSTALALSGIAKAILTPQEWVELRDHGVELPQIRHVNLAKYAMYLVEKLDLGFFERDRNLIRSCHMTPNKLELK